ncbi:MAG TPA: TraB/GumN family protein [Allosphingosinicella sp.]|nr:TraB/GumN family protein [Allosphingosinicella sp.]
MGWRRKSFAALLGALWLAAPAVAAPEAAAPARVPAAAAQPRAEPRPAIWLLADADTRIYLFGTVHVLHPDLRWRSAMFDRIAREAQELVLELADDQLAGANPEAYAMMRLARPVPVLDRVSAERRDGLARLMADLQIPEGSLDGLETWAVAVILGVGQMAQEYAGGEGSASEAAAAAPGVEETLTAEFRADGRPISGVETAADQIAAFRMMPANVQQAMLDETVDAYLTGEEAGDPDETDWIEGNLDGIAAEMDTLPPELYESLITRRNRGFTDWLARRLDRPGTVLFAIGAGHLAGRVSVQSMLERRGLTVRRIY